ncbi:prepilin-type N-terminal cleavage/methylation domain-containing protein [Persephonella sp.]|uniref:prepilin-type N-terminal cleavage/methylation domain-containing protein n=1 Tax=Persephonella sp. TaxID=2060922 RepID=UPI00261DDE96|nr:prepilin-type N-terminal cleavage/methylation domain-containing protein [Persephonella sp.]
MRNRGFTLIELAMVLIIIGLLMGIGITAFGILVKRAKVQSTKEIINAAADALISYAGSAEKLPGTDPKFQSIVRNSKDSFNKDIKFFVDADLTTNDKYVCRKNQTNLTVRLCKDSSCSSYIDVQNVAFLLVSGSENYNIQTGDGHSHSGTNVITISSPTTIFVYEYGVDNVDKFPSDINNPDKYDDIVKWITLPELQTKAQCKYKITILNNELPYGYENSSYNANLYADGGIPFSVDNDGDGKNDYEWCFEGDLPAGLTIDCAGSLSKSTNCLNTDGTVNNSANWKQCTSPKITGTISTGTAGSYNLKFYVHDSENNIAEKTLVLTVNPQSSSSVGGAAPPGSQVSFADNLSEFQQAGDNKGITVDNDSKVIYFGNGQNHTASCFWYPDTYDLSKYKVIRAFFFFRFPYQEKSDSSKNYADGFTFTIRNSPWTKDCGNDGGGLGYSGLDKSSVATEIDTYPNTSLKDPYKWVWFSFKGYNHLSIDFNGSVTHNDNLTSKCPSSGCFYKNDNPTWLEDNQKHSYRLELHTKCNNSCNRCGNNGNYILIKAWIDCENCDDLRQDFTDKPPLVSRCINNQQVNLNKVRFGFTEGTGGAVQTVKISYFGIRFE